MLKQLPHNVLVWLMYCGVLQLKKEVERAWDSDKDRDATPALRSKPTHGSTKRVEQFRKNMRRWMIGTPFM